MNSSTIETDQSTPPRPAAPEAEAQYLGGLLNHCTPGGFVADAEEFSEQRNEYIYEAIFAVAMEEKTVDPVTVGEELRKRGQLEIAGGHAYLKRLAAEGPSKPKDEHLHLIREKATAFKLQVLLGNAAGMAGNGAEPTKAIEHILKSLDDLKGRATRRDKPQTITAAELCAMTLPEPKWAVPGLIPEGLTILAGKPKLGKSWLILSTALAIAQGGYVLGNVPVKGGEALYISLEDTDRRLQSRILKLQRGMPAPTNLHLIRDWPRADAGGIQQLDTWLNEHPTARLVVIDTLEKFRPRRARGGNSYAEDYDALGDLQKLASKHGVAIVVVHHTTKATFDDPVAEISGTLGLSGSADGVLVLKRDRGRGDATLFASGRDVDELELALSWDKELATWAALGEAEDYRLSRDRQDIVNALREHGAPLTIKEVSVMLDKPYDTIKSALWQLSQAGVIKIPSRGKYMWSPDELREQNMQHNAAQLPEEQKHETSSTNSTFSTNSTSEPETASDQRPAWLRNVLNPGESTQSTESTRSTQSTARSRIPNERRLEIISHAVESGRDGPRAGQFLDAWEQKYETAPSVSDFDDYFPIWDTSGEITPPEVAT